MKRIGIDAGLADTAARKGLVEAVQVFARHRGVAHPELLIGPSLLLGAGFQRLTEQGPLRAIGVAGCVVEIGGDVPPLDAEIRMCAEIGRKGKGSAGNHVCKSFRRMVEATKALRPGWPAREAEHKRGARKGAAAEDGSIAHRQKSESVWLAASASALSPEAVPRPEPPASPRQPARPAAAGTPRTAAASRTL